jgi:hypothetical protein
MASATSGAARQTNECTRPAERDQLSSAPVGAALRVPITDEDRLVEPDTLGITIKLSFLGKPARLAPTDYSQLGQVLSPI